MRAYLAFFFATYVVVQVITFTECNPFDHYWQVLPAPGMYGLYCQVSDEANLFQGTCTEAQIQLITLGVLSIITDVMLIVMPIPVLIKWKRSWKESVQFSHSADPHADSHDPEKFNYTLYSCVGSL